MTLQAYKENTGVLRDRLKQIEVEFFSLPKNSLDIVIDCQEANALRFEQRGLDKVLKNFNRSVPSETMSEFYAERKINGSVRKILA